MHIELTPVQQVGFLLALAGLLVNNLGVVYFYFRIVRVLKENGVKPQKFQPLAFYFQLRLLIRTALSKEKKQDAQNMLIFLHRLMLITLGMVLFGSFLVMIGS